VFYGVHFILLSEFVDQYFEYKKMHSMSNIKCVEGYTICILCAVLQQFLALSLLSNISYDLLDDESPIDLYSPVFNSTCE